MQDGPIHPGSTDDGKTAEFRRRLADVIGGINHAIHHRLSSGDIAELRRLDPDNPGIPAFWKIMVSSIGDEGLALAGGLDRDEAEKRWAVVLSAMAAMANQSVQGRKLGDALADGGYSELRLNRLLRATGHTLRGLTREMTRFLTAKGEFFDLLDLARLVFSDGKTWSESYRREIARAYYKKTM